MKQKQRVVFQSVLFEQVEEIYEYLLQDSPQNAEKFRKEISSVLNKIERNPSAYTPIDSMNGVRKLYRYALVMKSWKIVFKATKTLLVFLGIVHTSRHPNHIKKLRTGKYDD